MFEIKFSTENDAFRGEDGRRDEYCEEQEVARILKRIAALIEEWGNRSGKVVDINGNGIGEWRFE